jgi:WD40 repeat protein
MDAHSTINVWDWKKGKILSTTRGHSDKVTSYFYLPAEVFVLMLVIDKK